MTSTTVAPAHAASGSGMPFEAPFRVAAIQTVTSVEVDANLARADALLAGRIARGICYAPAYTIMGGTTQVLRNIMGERVLGLPR